MCHFGLIFTISFFGVSQFLVLDEADRVLDVGFEEELRVIFQCLPKNRQTLLFSATMTNELQALLEISANRSYFFEAYEGFKTVDSLKQQYIFTPKNLKDLYLFHVLSKMEVEGIRSAIVFVSTCRYAFCSNLLYIFKTTFNILLEVMVCPASISSLIVSFALYM